MASYHRYEYPCNNPHFLTKSNDGGTDDNTWYTYASNNILEHDPLIGAEYIHPFVSPVLVLILVVAAAAVGVVLAVAKWKRKTVNIVGAS